MASLMPLEDALQQIATTVKPLSPRPLPLRDIDGCYLAQDCIARRTQPPFDVSAMDGYALPNKALAGESYHVVGEVPAGGQYTQTLGDGEAVRIFTGAPVPDGAVHVLIQEDALRNGDQLVVGPKVGDGANIRLKGGDFSDNDLLIKKGTKLTPQLLGLAAAANHATLHVHPKPKVAIIMNGDELVWPGDDAPKDAIIASNGYALAALAERFGAQCVGLDCVPDDADQLQSAISQAEEKGADLLIPIGGSSVGDYDLMRPALEAAGYALTFPKVALRPGKPTVFGSKPGHSVLGLPGNPVSSIVSAMIFLRPIVTALSGGSPEPLLPLLDAPLAAPLPANGPRAHFMRATCNEEGALAPVVSQDSSLLSLMGLAHALIYRPPNAPPAHVGDTCQWMDLPR